MALRRNGRSVAVASQESQQRHPFGTWPAHRLPTWGATVRMPGWCRCHIHATRRMPLSLWNVANKELHVTSQYITRRHSWFAWLQIIQFMMMMLHGSWRLHYPQCILRCYANNGWTIGVYKQRMAGRLQKSGRLNNFSTTVLEQMVLIVPRRRLRFAWPNHSSSSRCESAASGPAAHQHVNERPLRAPLHRKVSDLGSAHRRCLCGCEVALLCRCTFTASPYVLVDTTGGVLFCFLHFLINFYQGRCNVAVGQWRHSRTGCEQVWGKRKLLKRSRQPLPNLPRPPGVPGTEDRILGSVMSRAAGGGKEGGTGNAMEPLRT